MEIKQVPQFICTDGSVIAIPELNEGGILTSAQKSNNDRSNSLNKNNLQFKASKDNRSVQIQKNKSPKK